MKKINGLTLITISIILSLGLIVSSYMAVEGVKSIKSAPKSLTVTGSAKREIKSDVIVWQGSFSVDAPDMTSGYVALKENAETVKKYFSEKGIKPEEITFSSVDTYTRNRILDNGVYTNIVESYNLSQTVKINSTRVLEVAEIGRNSTELIEQGINFTSNNPQYFYSKLADLKIEMIGLATEDSKARAEAMVAVTGNQIGMLQSARVGVFQITSLYSNEIDDYGINDTSTYEKEITAVVTCDFEVK
ncbi:SIMPL domain-containing protein [Fusibacter ferrireducens]|uniref:SIMPL domain-containing protein n=1 Tax=Fusibacter ferrireducens TaxID=2785058 RepID=A0ABR9ZQG5_9FIRM|nr:SIMPL domain-containing protein [Fusibacter ferrireducens]MBF4692705.1 SIMPL domain-containing protein [Fusibacter ferrireducens]